MKPALFAYGEAVALSILDKAAALSELRRKPKKVYLYSFEMRAFEYFLDTIERRHEFRSGYYHGLELLTTHKTLQSFERFRFGI